MNWSDDELDQRVKTAVLADEIDVTRIQTAIRKRIGAERPISRWAHWAIAAAASILLAVSGSLAFRTFRASSIPALCTGAAEDHRREVVNGEPRSWLTDVASIESLAAKRGVPPPAVEALRATGYTLKHGKLCFFDHRLFLHLVFERDGRELSVYLRPRDGQPHLGNSIRLATVGGEHLAYFQTGQLTAVFVGPQLVEAFARVGAHALS